MSDATMTLRCPSCGVEDTRPLEECATGDRNPECHNCLGPMIAISVQGNVRAGGKEASFGKSLMEDNNQVQAALILRDRLVSAVQQRLDPFGGMPEDTWREWGEWRPIPPHSSGVFNPSPRKIAELAADVVLDVLTRAGGWKM